MTCLRLLFERDARARAEALGVLFGYNTRAKALKLIVRHLGHQPAFWPATRSSPWNYKAFLDELQGYSRPQVDPDQKPR